MLGWCARPLRRLLQSGRCLVGAFALGSLLAAPARATELKPETVAAFNEYIHATESRSAWQLRNGHFLIVDDLLDQDRAETYAQLRQGRIYIRSVLAREDDKPIHVPHGLIHDWVGVVYIPRATFAQAIAELQVYTDQPKIYAPTVRQAKILEHHGNEFKTFRQLYHKQIVTVVIDADFDDVFDMLNASQATIRSYSTRIAEVADPDEPSAHELPVGNDHGYVWRFYNYYRIEEKDGGVYVQVESITLTRSVPAAFAWLVNPLIKSIPRNVLTQLLSQMRDAILARKDP